MHQDTITTTEKARTIDFAEADRLERAWDELEHHLGHGGTAMSLDPADLDFIIADLVSIRHSRLMARGTTEGHRPAAAATVVLQHKSSIVIETATAPRDGLDELGPFAQSVVDAAVGPRTPNPLTLGDDGYDVDGVEWLDFDLDDPAHPSHDILVEADCAICGKPGIRQGFAAVGDDGAPRLVCAEHVVAA